MLLGVPGLAVLIKCALATLERCGMHSNAERWNDNRFSGSDPQITIFEVDNAKKRTE